MFRGATVKLLLCNFLMMGIFASQNLKGLESSKDYVRHVNAALRHFNLQFLQHRTNVVSLTVQSSCKGTEYIFNELANQFLRRSTNLKVMIQTTKVNNYNIWFVDSFEAVLKIDPGRNSKRQDFSEYYIIVLRTSAQTFMAEQQRIFEYFWRYHIMNVNIIRETDEQEVALYTYYPFLENNCNRPQSVRLNPNFSIDLLTARQLFPNKLEDLHQCKLTAALWNEPPYLVLPAQQEEGLLFKGIEGRLLHVLAEAMNFSLGYVVPPNNEQRGLVFPNRTVTGALKLLVEKEADLSLGGFRCKVDRSTVCSASKSFYHTPMVFTVLAARSPWTTYEILVYPFDIPLWLALICMLTALSLLAVWLQSKHPKVFSFVFNCPPHAPIPMQLTAALLGVSAHHLPRRNFARFLWSVWQWLSLLLRCAYQCALFRFLSTQKTIPPPKTMYELVQQGYKLILHLSVRDALSDIPLIRRGLLEVITFNTTNVTYAFQKLEGEPLQKYVAGVSIDALTYYANSKGKHDRFHVLKETIFSLQNCIYFTKHSFLVPAVNQILSNLCGGGLIEYWAEQYLYGPARKAKDNDKLAPSKKPFTMVQLYGAFEILYCLWFLAVLVFVVELLWFRIKILKNCRKI